MAVLVAIALAPGAAPDSWILRTPDCWGQRACQYPVGIGRFLRTLETDLSRAKQLEEDELRIATN